MQTQAHDLLDYDSPKAQWEAWGSSRGYSIELVRTEEQAVRSADKSTLRTPELVYNGIPSRDQRTALRSAPLLLRPALRISYSNITTKFARTIS